MQRTVLLAAPNAGSVRERQADVFRDLDAVLKFGEAGVPVAELARTQSLARFEA